MKTIVMTGGSSGIGAVAARRIAASAGTRLLLGSRRGGPAGAQVLPLDLTRLDRVRAFAAAVRERFEGGIDGLVLNAGTALTDPDRRTEDGFETIFAVNHLAHYLLLRLLMPHLAEQATVVLTTSSTHDPAAGTMLPPPRHADARLLAHPDRDPDRDPAPRAAVGRAYAASKLCNILTARALASQPEARARRLTVVAYDPGPTPGTGLVRHGPFVVRAAWQLLVPLRPLLRRFNSRAAAGGTLAGLALGAVAPPPGRIYASLRRGGLGWPDPSELARRDDLRDDLWRDSADLVGLPLDIVRG